jgi:hypothetical protein
VSVGSPSIVGGFQSTCNDPSGKRLVCSRSGIRDYGAVSFVQDQFFPSVHLSSNACGRVKEVMQWIECLE